MITDENKSVIESLVSDLNGRWKSGIEKTVLYRDPDMLSMIIRLKVRDLGLLEKIKIIKSYDRTESSDWCDLVSIIENALNQG